MSSLYHHFPFKFMTLIQISLTASPLTMPEQGLATQCHCILSLGLRVSSSGLTLRGHLLPCCHVPIIGTIRFGGYVKGQSCLFYSRSPPYSLLGRTVTSPCLQPVPHERSQGKLLTQNLLRHPRHLAMERLFLPSCIFHQWGQVSEAKTPICRSC